MGEAVENKEITDTKRKRRKNLLRKNFCDSVERNTLPNETKNKTISKTSEIKILGDR